MSSVLLVVVAFLLDNVAKRDCSVREKLCRERDGVRHGDPTGLAPVVNEFDG